MHFLDAVENFEIAGIEIDACANGGKHSLACPGGAVNRKTHSYQVFNDILDLLFGRGVLHGNNHSESVSRQSSGCRHS